MITTHNIDKSTNGIIANVSNFLQKSKSSNLIVVTSCFYGVAVK